MTSLKHFNYFMNDKLIIELGYCKIFINYWRSLNKIS